MNDINNEQLMLKAIEKIESLEEQLHAQQSSIESAAIIGLSAHLGGGIKSLEALDKYLREKQTGFCEVPDDRWDVAKYYDENEKSQGKYYTKTGCFIDDIYDFDASLFNMTPAEALDLDPQHRLLLKHVYQLVTDFEQVKENLRGQKVGVFAAVGSQDYALTNMHHPDTKQINHFGKLGTCQSIGPGRISHAFDFKGPCLYLDTSCSSSLTALHLARQSLNANECDYAIVAAANLLLGPNDYIGFCKLKALSPTGECLPFDASANGYVRAEGVGAVLLTKYSVAKKKKIPIYANVLGSALNHDGNSNGLTAPSSQSQIAVLHQALANAGVKAEQVAHIEAHGTGTKLGDPIEMDALSKVYGQQQTWISSLKGNIGHMEQAAGLGALLKSILILQKQVIYPQAYFANPNSYIHWQTMACEVPTEVVELDAPINYVGLSGFGMSGTNAHIILEKGDFYRQVPLKSVASKPKRYQKPFAKTANFLPIKAKFKDLFKDHLLFDNPTMPGAYMITDYMALLSNLDKFDHYALENIDFQKLVDVTESSAKHLTAQINQGKIELSEHADEVVAKSMFSHDHLKDEKLVNLPLKSCKTKREFYEQLNSSGLVLQQRFQGVEHVYQIDEYYLGLVLPKLNDNRWLDFSTLDSCFQVASMYWPWKQIHKLSCFLPFSIEAFQAKACSAQLLWVLVKPLSSTSSNQINVDIQVFNEDHELCVNIKNMQFIYHDVSEVKQHHIKISQSKDSLETMMRLTLMQLLNMSTEEIVNDVSFDKFGVDSILALDIADEVEKQLKIKISLKDLNPSSSIDSVVQSILSMKQEECQEDENMIEISL